MLARKCVVKGKETGRKRFVCIWWPQLGLRKKTKKRKGNEINIERARKVWLSGYAQPTGALWWFTVAAFLPKTLTDYLSWPFQTSSASPPGDWMLALLSYPCLHPASTPLSPRFDHCPPAHQPHLQNQACATAWELFPSPIGNSSIITQKHPDSPAFHSNPQPWTPTQ